MADLNLIVGTEPISIGDVIPLARSQLRHTIEFLGDTRREYFIFMVDPDAPSARDPYLRWWIHWFFVARDCKDTILDFVPPAPPPGSGPHRYYIFVYSRLRTHRQEIPEPQQRQRFDLSEYVKSLGLRLDSYTFYITEN